MARTQWRNKFDRERDFVVRRKLTLSGKTHAPGEPLDKSLVTTRRLRQLFDARVIMFAGENPGAHTDVPEGLRNAARRAREAKTGRAERSARHAEAEAKRQAERAQADALAARGAVEIPDNWPHMAWPARLSLASKLTDAKVHNGDEAAAAIEAELARRARTS